MLNFILVFLIIASFVFYFYFKTRQFRTKSVYPIRKKMFASMAGTSLGGLLLFFGINQLLLFNGIVTYLIAALFIGVGAYVVFFNFRAYKHYLNFVDEEYDLNKS